MRWGLVARPELNRGLGVQTASIAEHLHPDKILTVILPESGKDMSQQWAGDATVFFNKGRFYDIESAINWAKGLDVVLSVETFYDTRFPAALPKMWTKSVLYGNPEFHAPHLFTPDAYWWPTSWLRNKITRGPIVPMGVDPGQAKAAGCYDSGPLRVIHPIGRPALGDRNGTKLVLEALRFITEPVHLTITALHSCDALDAWALGQYEIGPNVTVDVEIGGADDRWGVYEGQHVFLLPRRYGGNCLPAQEAAACGLALLMSDCSPNAEYPGYLMASSKHSVETMPVGQVHSWRTPPSTIGRTINHFASRRDQLCKMQEKSLEWAAARTWDQVAPLWIEGMKKLCA